MKLIQITKKLLKKDDFDKINRDKKCVIIFVI